MSKLGSINVCLIFHPFIKIDVTAKLKLILKPKEVTNLTELFRRVLFLHFVTFIVDYHSWRKPTTATSIDLRLYQAILKQRV